MHFYAVIRPSGLFTGVPCISNVGLALPIDGGMVTLFRLEMINTGQPRAVHPPHDARHDTVMVLGWYRRRFLIRYASGVDDDTLLYIPSRRCNGPRNYVVTAEPHV